MTLECHSNDVASNGRQWEMLLEKTFIPGTVSPRAETASRIEKSFKSNHLTIARLSANAQAIEHTTSHLQSVSPSARHSVLVHVILTGNGHIQQEGRTICFRPGDISYRNVSHPSRVVFETHTELFAVRLPSIWLPQIRDRTAGRHGLQPHVTGSDDTFAQLIRDLLGELGRRGSPGDICTSFALPWLLAGAYNGTEENISQTATQNLSRWQQALDYIDRNMFDPHAMAPSVCATSIGISERYLHRLFAFRGLRYSRFVLERRLDMAREFLTDSSYERVSIASICYQTGFNDPAHFSRVFRRHFGLSPKQFRDSYWKRK